MEWWSGVFQTVARMHSRQYSSDPPERVRRASRALAVIQPTVVSPWPSTDYEPDQVFVSERLHEAVELFVSCGTSNKPSFAPAHDQLWESIPESEEICSRCCETSFDRLMVLIELLRRVEEMLSEKRGPAVNKILRAAALLVKNATTKIIRGLFSSRCDADSMIDTFRRPAEKRDRVAMQFPTVTYLPLAPVVSKSSAADKLDLKAFFEEAQSPEAAFTLEPPTNLAPSADEQVLPGTIGAFVLGDELPLEGSAKTMLAKQRRL